ncbi:MAG: sensor histidine kinase [Flavobacteriales bacterium]
MKELNSDILKLLYAGYLDKAEKKNNQLKNLSENQNSFYYKCHILSSALIANLKGDNKKTLYYLNLIEEHHEPLIIRYYYHNIFSRYAFNTGQFQLGVDYLKKTIEIGKKISDNMRIKIDTAFNNLYLIYYTQNIEYKLSSNEELPATVEDHLHQLHTYERFMLPHEKYKYYTYLIFFTHPNKQEEIFELAQKLIKIGKKQDIPTASVNGNLHLATYHKKKYDSVQELNHLMLANIETQKIQFLYPILWVRYRIMDYYDTYENYPLAKRWAKKAFFPPGTDYSMHFDIYGRLSDIYEKTGQIDSAYHYKKIDYDKYKDISRAHDNNMESLLIKSMKKNIAHKESIIKRNYGFIMLILLGLFSVGFLLYKNNNINHKLALQNKQLEESYTTLENFSHILSHDLKAPIRSINHLATFMEEDEEKLSEEGKENLNLIKQSTNNAFILITNIMTYIHSKDTEIKKDRHIFKIILRKAQNNLAQLISSSRTLILFDDLPKTIYGNDVLLIQLFQNLIQNSIKYKKKNTPPVITISYKKEGKYGIISIHDNGIGIKETKKDAIFRAFTQEKFVSPEQGIGLGLSICKNIMSHHKGKIKALSKKKFGTTINLYFPINFIE